MKLASILKLILSLFSSSSVHAFSENRVLKRVKTHCRCGHVCALACHDLPLLVTAGWPCVAMSDEMHSESESASLASSASSEGPLHLT